MSLTSIVGWRIYSYLAFFADATALYFHLNKYQHKMYQLYFNSAVTTGWGQGGWSPPNNFLLKWIFQLLRLNHGEASSDSDF